MTTEIRCKKCNKLLCKVETFIGEIKCHRCKKINVVKVISQKSSCCNQ